MSTSNSVKKPASNYDTIMAAIKQRYNLDDIAKMSVEQLQQEIIP